MNHVWIKETKTFAKKIFEDTDDKNCHRVRDDCHYGDKYRGVVHIICNLWNKTPKELPAVFHNGSNNDYHFVKKEAAEFKEQFECLDEYRKKHSLFSNNKKRN